MIRDDLRQALLDWIAAWQAGDPSADDPSGERFDRLALELFAFQFEHIAAYRAFCIARDALPDRIATPADIPLVPVPAFQFATLCTEAAASHPAAVFETSGTTGARPGQVRLAETALYDASLEATFRTFVTPDAPQVCGDAASDRFRCISLVPTAAARPRSSLGHMVRRLTARLGDGAGSEHLGGASGQEGLDTAGLRAALERACGDGRPVLLFATSIALELWLADHPTAPRLPAGSRLMDTGGPKGRHLQLSRQEQHARLAEMLGIDADFIVGELGMTELSSQRYETTLRHRIVGDLPAARAYAGPPWLRSRVLRPTDRAACAPGEPGMLAHLDLANLDTCAFILTADLGRIVRLGSGIDALELAGRLPGSDWRGCGLDAEELATPARAPR